MYSASGDSDARLQCLPLGVHPLEGREERWVDIKHPSVPGPHEGACQDAHEPGQADQLHPGRLKLDGDGCLELLTRLVVLV